MQKFNIGVHFPNQSVSFAMKFGVMMKLGLTLFFSFLRSRMYVIGVVFKYLSNRNCNSLCESPVVSISSVQPMFWLVFLSIQLQISANNALLSLSAIELSFFIFKTPMKIFSTLLVRFIENALDKTLNAFLYGLGTSIEFVL